MPLQFNIDYSNFTPEDMRVVARAMAKQYNKPYIEHNLNTAESLFGQEQLEAPDKLQDKKIE